MLSQKPMCFNIVNKADWYVTGSIETKPHQQADGETLHHRSNFRLAPDESTGACTTGPFYDGYRVLLTLRTLIPIFECYTVAQGEIIINGKKNADGSTTTEAICK